MKMKKLTWFSLLRLFGIVLFIYIVTTVDIQDAWKTIKFSSPSYIFLSLLFQIFLLLIKANRWYALKVADVKNISWLKSSSQFLESYAVGVATPGRLGEFIKVGHEEKGLNKISSISRIIYERGFDLSFFACTGGMFLVYYFDEAVSYIGWSIMIIGFAILLFTLLLMANGRTIQFMVGKVSRILKLKNKIVLGFYPLRISVNIFFLSVVSNFCTFISGWLLAHSVNIFDTFLSISGVISITGIINLLPISVMGIGTREASFLFFLSEYSKDQIFAFSMLMFLVVQLGGAVFALIISQIFSLVENLKFQTQKG